MTTQRKRGGRPELPPDQRAVHVTMRARPDRARKLRDKATRERMFAWLDRQPMPADDDQAAVHASPAA